MAERRLKVVVNGKAYVVEVGDLEASAVEVIVNGRAYAVTIESPAADPEPASAALEPVVRKVPPPRQAPVPAGPTGAQVAEVRAPMPGNVVEVFVRPGERVSLRQPLCALEAMKMKNIIGSPRDGVVAAVHVTPGQAVAHGDLLFTFA